MQNPTDNGSQKNDIIELWLEYLIDLNSNN